MNLWNLFLRKLRRETSASRATSRKPRRSRDAERFRLSVLALEDRTVPAADMFAGATVLTGARDGHRSNVGASAEDGRSPPHHVGIRANQLRLVAVDPPPMVLSKSTRSAARWTRYWRCGPGRPLTKPRSCRHDDFFGPQSQVLFTAQAGTTYYISVDGFAGDTGDITLNLAMAPANDNFADAANVTVGTYTGSNIGATAEANEPIGDGTNTPINSVWWKWTAQTSELVEFNTIGSDLDTVLAVYTGSSIDTLQLLTSNDDIAEGELQSLVLFEAQEGTTYYISVDGAQFTATSS